MCGILFCMNQKSHSKKRRIRCDEYHITLLSSLLPWLVFYFKHPSFCVCICVLFFFLVCIFNVYLCIHEWMPLKNEAMRKRREKKIKQWIKLIDEILKIRQFWIMIITLDSWTWCWWFSERGVDNLIFFKDLVIGCRKTIES